MVRREGLRDWKEAVEPLDLEVFAESFQTKLGEIGQRVGRVLQRKAGRPSLKTQSSKFEVKA